MLKLEYLEAKERFFSGGMLLFLIWMEVDGGKTKMRCAHPFSFFSSFFFFLLFSLLFFFAEGVYYAFEVWYEEIVYSTTIKEGPAFTLNEEFCLFVPLSFSSPIPFSFSPLPLQFGRPKRIPPQTPHPQPQKNQKRQ